MGEELREKAERKAYRLLALRAYSERELRGKLLKAGFPEALVAAVIEKCRALGYLDDALYARQRARELAVNRLAGDRRIALDLAERGIDGDLGRAAIAEVASYLGNTPAIARSSYVDPRIVDRYHAGEIIALPVGDGRTSADGRRSARERAVIDLLG